MDLHGPQLHIRGLRRVALWGDALRLLAPGEREVHMESALALATERGISAYDAHYVALAHALRVPLVTADRRLRQALPGQLLSMQDFCALEESP
jgi:predicted nucleic acid-binding protein